MAPFLTHLVIGERVWAALDAHCPGQQDVSARSTAQAGEYGTFLFGCLAADVDKFCPGLEQSVTHFVGKDEARTYVWRRSQHFLDHPTDFLRAPFHVLEASEKAFVLGYLCHVATDEISGRIGTNIKTQLPSGVKMPHGDAILTVLDRRFWLRATAPADIVSALETAPIPGSAFTFAPLDCLTAMHRIILPQIREGGGLEPYLNTLRRQWQWLRHGQVGDTIDDPSLEAELVVHRHEIKEHLPAAERMVETIELEPFAQEATDHSLQRIHVLLNGEKTP
jgi:hypothetical protein